MPEERTTTRATTGGRARTWLLGLLPLVLLGGLLALILAFEPAEVMRRDAPPVEDLAIRRVELSEDGFRLTVLNDGPDPVTVAQVLVDEAYWSFSVLGRGDDDAAGGVTLDHLESARLHVPYPWVHGEAHEIRLITATGATFDHEVAVAVATPRPSGRFFAVFALIGLYVGVLPVALGLAWYPFVGRVGRRGLDFLLALTLGLLVFLLVDAFHDGLEVGAAAPHSYQGVVLFIAVALLAYLAIELLGGTLKRRGGEGGSAARAAWITALLIALSIGFHNFAEGLAIGAAYALGEATLGALLILGFALHNTTEGLAIVAPLAEHRQTLARLAVLGLLAGAPTIAGAWIGGLVYSPVWALVFLAVGAGAIAQVIVQITRALAGERPMGQLVRTGPFVGGLAAGLAVMYLTGMLIG